jgi:hypothetical protein
MSYFKETAPRLVGFCSQYTGDDGKDDDILEDDTMYLSRYICINVLEESAAHHLKSEAESSPETLDAMHQTTCRHNIQHQNILSMSPFKINTT